MESALFIVNLERFPLHLAVHVAYEVRALRYLVLIGPGISTRYCVRVV